MLSVLAEFLNFTTMLSLFAKSPKWVDMYTDERVFAVWIFVEATVVVSTVAVNIVYVIIRSCFREAVVLEFDGKVGEVEEETPDYNRDFLSSENN